METEEVQPPVATASSNSPVCKGDTIELYGGPDGTASYRWVGPNGWTSNVQNPTRPNATLAMAGDYALIVTDANGCSDSDSTNVVVGAGPIGVSNVQITYIFSVINNIYGGDLYEEGKAKYQTTP